MAQTVGGVQTVSQKKDRELIPVFAVMINVFALLNFDAPRQTRLRLWQGDLQHTIIKLR